MLVRDVVPKRKEKYNWRSTGWHDGITKTDYHVAIRNIEARDNYFTYYNVGSSINVY